MNFHGQRLEHIPIHFLAISMLCRPLCIIHVQIGVVLIRSLSRICSRHSIVCSVIVSNVEAKFVK